MRTRTNERFALASDLHRALDRDEFELLYQPIVRLADDAVVGAEALIRWRHPQRGLIGPTDFIPLAEDTGLIVDIGAWVVESACAALRCLSDSDPKLATLGISVNVSVKQLRATGVRIAVDDFGTGYSSLAYLKHLPLDTLKIDRSIVEGLGSDPCDEAIVASALGVSRALVGRVAG
jgi:EAL domain-containing protein (putative c-di-GMP-specific phosphodiesterase class I)